MRTVINFQCCFALEQQFILMYKANCKPEQGDKKQKWFLRQTIVFMTNYCFYNPIIAYLNEWVITIRSALSISTTNKILGTENWKQ